MKKIILTGSSSGFGLLQTTLNLTLGTINKNIKESTEGVAGFLGYK